ncbi:MAG: T9SS type A sorting domain-containing protein [Vicingus serpentipes]|nr:T9SS type A sorting domain-containing protein [Vicingus serpentipes]
MKRLILHLLLILSSSLLIAQPILTNSNFTPVAGESQLYFVADTNSVIDNTTGANVIFNYTQLRDYGQTQTQYFVDPTTTANTSDYPSATYTDTTGGFAGNMKYNQSFTTDSLNIIGLVLDINSFGRVVAKYDDDPEIIMKFPFGYGDTYTDDYGGTFTSAAAPLPTKGRGSVTVTADAWGTLELPMSVTIDSVLRVVRVEDLLTDTIFLQPILPNILPIQVSAIQTSYYKPSLSKNPLLSFIETYIAGDTIITVVSQYDMFGVGIEEFKENIQLNIFPNPTSSVTSVSFNLETATFVTAQLMNSVGQKVALIYNGQLQKGSNKLNIDTSNLSKGIYLINLTFGNKTITAKLLVE